MLLWCIHGVLSFVYPFYRRHTENYISNIFFNKIYKKKVLIKNVRRKLQTSLIQLYNHLKILWTFCWRTIRPIYNKALMVFDMLCLDVEDADNIWNTLPSTKVKKCTLTVCYHTVIWLGITISWCRFLLMWQQSIFKQIVMHNFQGKSLASSDVLF